MITVYADLNCPFCYALNEWVHEAGLENAIDWQLVNHNPSASYRSFTNKELIDLTDEIFTLRHRASDLPITLPSGRPNVLQAEALLYAVKRHYPDAYAALRRTIYRAIWVDDKNIESDELLNTYLAQLNISDLEFNQQAYDELKQSTSNWNHARYLRRIPVIAHHSEEFMLGLAPKQETLRYLHNANEKPEDFSIKYCVHSERPWIAVMGDWSEFWEIGKPLRDYNDILLYSAAETLCELISESSGPDCVILSMQSVTADSYAQYENIIKRCVRLSCPLLVITADISTTDTIDLYRRGCSEIMRFNQGSELLSIKVQRLIKYRRMVNQLFKTSLTDSLTELGNQRSFINTLEQEWSRASRSQQPISLLFLDIDYFKKYNDEYGHLAGDGCLREVAEVIRSQLYRRSDIAFRIGGEEFALLLPGVDQTGAIDITQRLLQAIRQRALPHVKSIHKVVTLSIGVATQFYDQEINTNDLVKMADEQMYMAKAAGRNTHQVLSD